MDGLHELTALASFFFDQLVKPVQRHGILPSVGMIPKVEVYLNSVRKPFHPMFFFNDSLLKPRQSSSQLTQFDLVVMDASFQSINPLKHQLVAVLKSQEGTQLRAHFIEVST
jgi:hypothetical protein